MTNQNWTFVSAAYAATWIMMVGYWVHVHGALRRARRAYEEATGTRPGGAS